MDAADVLSKAGNKVYLIYRKEQFRAFESLVAEVKSRNNVEIMLDSDVFEIMGAQKLEKIKVKNSANLSVREIEADGLFIEIGHEPKTEFAAGLVKRDEKGQIIVDAAGQTSQPGVFAAGDVTPVAFKQIIVGCGQGAVAAGRGPLAGPVVAACIVFNDTISINNELLGINDSKKLSAKKREELFELIKNNFIEVGVGICDHQTIDRINILQATFLAMKKALSAVKSRPEFLLIDGSLKLPNCSTPQQAIIKGDGKVFSIAAASIIAKVTRDRIMLEMDKLYPNYEFKRHKGYGTKLHLERIKQFGPCPIHRLSFNRVHPVK